MEEKDWLYIADKLKAKGHEYYDKDDKNKTAIFWELEAIIRQMLKNRTYCLFLTCKHFAEETCKRDDYYCFNKRLTLEQSKTEFPDVNFCSDWERGRRE